MIKVEGYLTSKQVCKRLNDCSPTTLWRYQQKNQTMFSKPLPAPVKRGAGSSNLWSAEEFSIWEDKHFRNNIG